VVACICFASASAHVAEQVPLVELVEEDHAHVGQRRIILQPPEQNPFRHEANPRAHAGLVVEADLVADLLPELPAALPGDARGDGPGGDAARLQHDDALRRRRGDRCRRGRRPESIWGTCVVLPEPVGRHQHEPWAARQGVEDVGMDFPDGERRVGHARHDADRRAEGQTANRPAGAGGLCPP
jgi:hypothetical protein